MTPIFKPNSPLANVLPAPAAIKLIASGLSVCAVVLCNITAAAEDLDGLIADGRAIYRGSQPLVQPPTLHDVPLPGSSANCASCHGVRGAARTEGGVAVPAIQWQRLAQSTPARAAYVDLAQVLNAVMDGKTTEGRTLSAPMPRFNLDAQEQRALTAYLQVLGTEADPAPGVGEHRIVLGTVLPQSGPQGAAGASIRGALQRRIATINTAGGIFGRHLELVVADAGPNDASATQAAIDLVRSGRVFALVASLGVRPTDALRQVLARHDTAMVATLGIPLNQPRDALLSWLLPSLQQQAMELASKLERLCPPRTDAATPTRVLYLAGGELGEMAELGRPAQLDAPDQRALPAGLHWQAVTDTATLRTALRQQPAARAVVLLPSALADVARAEVAAQGPSGSCIGTLAAVSGESNSTAKVRELVALPMPPVPLHDGADARTALWSMLADSSLAVMAETLSRAGRQLDTGRLVAALDTLHRFEPRPGLPVSFSARQRHGLEVSYLWKEGPHETHSSRR
jgi:mono/diheme cytochrome c family protein